MNILITIIVGILLLVTQIVLGVQKNAQTRQVYQYLLHDARQRSQQSFSIIIYLDRRAETIFPLLDHLQSFKYKKLQIIVIVKQTAGSKANATLQTYRRRNKIKLMSVVRYKKGLGLEKIAQRYATQTYLMTMAPNDRLSPRFFVAASQILVTSNIKNLAIREVIRPVGTFAQALSSLASLFHYSKILLPLKPAMEPSRTLMHRVNFISGSLPKAMFFLPNQCYITPVLQAKEKPTPKRSVYVTALAIGVIGLALFFIAHHLNDSITAILYDYLIVALPIIVVVITMLALRGYAHIDYLNLALFVPLAPFYAFAHLALQGLRWAIVPRHRQLSTRQ